MPITRSVVKRRTELIFPFFLFNIQTVIVWPQNCYLKLNNYLKSTKPRLLTNKETLMVDNVFNEIIDGMKKGQVVPYLGPGVLQGSTNKLTGEPIPADSDSLIYAMNDGKPMAPKLMYEFPRAAMNLELKRGRSFVNKFLTKLYAENEWTRSPLHDLRSGRGFRST